MPHKRKLDNLKKNYETYKGTEYEISEIDYKKARAEIMSQDD